MTSYREMPSGTRWPVEGTTHPAAGQPHTGALTGPWSATALNLTVPTDSRELVPIDVTAAGQPVTTDLQVSLSTTRDARDWQPLHTAGGRTYLQLGGRARGTYRVTVRHTSGAVMAAGWVIVR